MQISILIPAYNQQKLLDRALNSIKEQTFSNQLEIIISDDCSPIPIKINESELNISLFRQDKNLGVLKNFEFLVNKASCNLITIFQYDDYLIDQTFYEVVYNSFKENKNAAVFFSNALLESTKKPMIRDNFRKVIQKISRKTKNNSFLINGEDFCKLNLKGMNTSWSSIVWDNAKLKKISKFGSYVPNKLLADSFLAYGEEEGGGYLYLLASKYYFLINFEISSFRGVPESNFSGSVFHPGRNKPNDIDFFIFWNIYKKLKKINPKISRLALKKSCNSGVLKLNKSIFSFLKSEKNYMTHIILSNLSMYKNKFKIFIIRIPHRFNKYIIKYFLDKFI